MPSLTELELAERRRVNLELYARYGIRPISGGSPDGDPADGDPHDDPIPDSMDSAAKAALQKERDARKQAAKDAREAKAALAALQAKQDEADAAKAAAEAEEARKKGEWEKLATDRESQISKVTGERDGLKAENDALAGYFNAQYEAALKELPEVITAFKPADDAGVAAKAAWLATAQEQAKKINGGTPTSKGAGFRPPPSNGGSTRDEAISRSKRSGKYTA